MGARLRDFLDNPLSGLAPWIVMAVMSGVVRFEFAVGLSLATALTILIANAVTGGTVKILEYADTAFFLVLGIVGLVASPDVLDWLRVWADELSNIALAVIAVGSLLIRQPFTLPYAREEVPRAVWGEPRFIRTNYLITGAWAAAFVVAAISGFVGDAILDDSENLWAAWIIPTAAMLASVQFTLWYPRVVRARTAIAEGRPTEPQPPTAELFAGLIGYLPLVGIVVLVADAAPWWVGVGLIVAGPVIGGRIAKTFRDERSPAAEDPTSTAG